MLNEHVKRKKKQQKTNEKKQNKNKTKKTILTGAPALPY